MCIIHYTGQVVGTLTFSAYIRTEYTPNTRRYATRFDSELAARFFFKRLMLPNVVSFSIIEVSK